MSLITRCPACETMFKVVPDQLRISEGWVRCGQCGEVFDASQNLLANPNDEGAAPLGSRIEVARGNTAPGAPPASAVMAKVDTPPLSPAYTHDQPITPQPVRHDPEPVRDAAPQAASSESPWVETVAPEETPSEPAPVPARKDQRAAPNPVIAAQPADEDAPEVSFMRGGKKKTLWHRPMVRVILLLLVLLLIAVLAVQVLTHERNRIAVMEPSTRPALLALCAWTGCTLSPLRQIESIAIESSSFTLARGDNYKLAFSLKNNALFDLAMPAMELALTDGQDQALIRRVILPTELGATSSNTLAAGSDWNGALSLSVKSGASVDRIAGYRLLAFYP